MILPEREERVLYGEEGGTGGRAGDSQLSHVLRLFLPFFTSVHFYQFNEIKGRLLFLP